LTLTVDGEPVPLEMHSNAIEFLEGQGGLQTLRLTMQMVGALPARQSAWQVHYRDDNHPGRLGWREIVVRPLDGAELTASSVPSEDVTDELRSYPTDLLQNPIVVHEATFTFGAGTALDAGTTVAGTVPVPAEAARGTAEFAALIEQREFSAGTILLALLAAFGWGAAHALTPGHGKTIVAAYLVGSRGTARHALFLGLTTTITHTAGVFALGLVTLFLSRYFLPEQLYPWLGVVSGVLVVSIGLSILAQRVRGLRAGPASHDHHGHSHSHDHHHAHHDHSHSHDHHDHDHGHRHDHHTHSHLPPGVDGAPVTWRSLLALGVSGGLLPCPSALIVLLSAVALQRVGFGLLLITAFSIGLASVLTGIGILLVHARKLFNRIPASGPALRLLPVASACLITVLGMGITLQALVQTGILPPVVVAATAPF
ncbi:MAG: nickel/cobalt transporter, partial [Ardenticatenaceae bacterium]